MNGYIKLKTINLEPDKYGKHIKITKVGLYDDNDKWIKWLPINDHLLNFLQDQKFNVVINKEAL